MTRTDLSREPDLVPRQGMLFNESQSLQQAIRALPSAILAGRYDLLSLLRAIDPVEAEAVEDILSTGQCE